MAISVWKVWEEEFLKTGLLALFICVLKLNLGLTGTWINLFLLVIAAFISIVYTIDTTGVKYTYGINRPSWIYLTYFAMDLLMILLGLMLFGVIVRLPQGGVDVYKDDTDDDRQFLQKLTGGSFLLEIIYKSIASFVVMACVRCPINLAQVGLLLFPSGG